MSAASNSAEEWPQAMATVTGCHYSFGAGRALAFGAPTTKHFRISFNYWVGKELQNGEFASEKAMPQGTLFPVRYNPQAPGEYTAHPEPIDEQD